MGKWIRPDFIPYPSVWLRFQAKDSDSDDIVNYRIQDLPEDRFSEAVDHMVKYFLVDEVLCTIKGYCDCPETVAETREIWEHCLKKKLSLACFKENSDELVAVNIIVVAHKNGKEVETKSKICKEVFEVLAYVANSVNIFEKFNTDVVMSSSGLSVTPKYRNRGIAQQLLAARVPFGKAVGLTVTSTVFTSAASQKSAARAGFKEEQTCTYEEFKLNGMDFPGVKPLKLMTLKIS